MQTTQAEMHPARTIAEDVTIEHRTPSSLVKQQYHLLDAIIKGKEVGEFFIFNEKEHVNELLLTQSRNTDSLRVFSCLFQ